MPSARFPMTLQLPILNSITCIEIYVWYCVQFKDFLCSFFHLWYVLTNLVFRLGKSLDMIMGAMRARDIHHDTVLKVLIICRRITYTIYYIIDHVTWAARLGLYKSNPKEWSKFQAKFWALALAFGLLRNLYDILNLVFVPVKKHDGEESYSQGSSVTARLMSRPQVLLDTLKNLADCLLPYNVMGLIELNVGLAGLLGLTSSIAGAIPVWSPNMKLKPS